MIDAMLKSRAKRSLPFAIISQFGNDLTKNEVAKNHLPEYRAQQE